MNSIRGLFLFLFSLSVMLSCSDREEIRQSFDETMYRKVGDEWQNYSVAIIPDGEIQGLIVLLPGFGKPPEKFLYEIKLDSIAVHHGLMMLVPSPQGWGTHYLDEASIDTLHLMIREAAERYNLTGKKFVIGGFSIGGTGALRYAEHIIERALEQDVTLAGAFAVDSPLDFERLWYSVEKELQKGPSQEAEYFMNGLKNTLGGSPKQQRLNYAKSSPFLASEQNGGRVQLIKNIPLRLYVEPDTLWWKANGWLEYKYQNAQDMDGVVEQLRKLGNQEVELVKTRGKGYRKSGTRHPHSWSIVDEPALVDWILKAIQKH